MPDFGAPVAAQTTGASGGLKTLSDLMGLQQKKQAIESSALTIQQQQQNLTKGAAETQATQQTTAQRAAIANVDWSKYDDGTGTISTDKMLGDADLRKAAGDKFLDVLHAGATARTQQLQNKQALVGLNDSLRNQFGTIIGALRTDPDVVADTPAGREKVSTAIAQFGQAGGPDAQRVAEIYAPVAQHAPPGKLVRGISAIQLQAQDAGRQAASQAPAYQSDNSQLVQTNPQAAGGDLGNAQNIPLTVAPGQREGVSTDPLGNLIVPTKDAQGHVTGAPPVPGGSAAPVFQAGDKEAIPALEAERVNAKNAALAAPEIHNNTRGIVSELNNVSATGVAGPAFQKLNSALGGVLNWGTPEEKASSYDKVGKYLERNALQLAQGMGPHTNAGLDTVKAASGSVHYNPSAIRDIANLVDANATGQETYYPALERFIQASGQKGVLAKREFDQQWGANYDPRIFQLENASKAGDAAEVQRIKKQLGPNGVAELRGKIMKLRALTGGQ